MEQNELRTDLTSLHTELSALDTVDPESKELLEQIKTDIQKVLEHTGDQPAEHHATLLRRLNESTEYFEIAHPHLTAIVNNIITTLNTWGI